MIKTTVKNGTKRNAFAKAGGKKIAGGVCTSGKIVNGLVLDNYNLLATGVCADKTLNNDLSNVILFNKQREVA